MSKAILVTGATGKQGSAVVNALLALQNKDFSILAVTRNTASPSAQKLAAKSPVLKLVQGDLNDCPELFKSAENVMRADGLAPRVWGVYSVQISMGPGVTMESEIRQGKSLIDASLEHGVEHIVYSSVERGGDEHSWDNETNVEHFKTKAIIERYLRERAEKTHMSWTILRPVAFMDNLAPGMPTRVFLAALRNTLGKESMQWVAVKDIGVFAAKAFADPDAWSGKAIGLAGDDLGYDGVVQATGGKAYATFGILGSLLMWGVAEMGRMVSWFRDEGYKADIQMCRRQHPGMLTMEAWVKEESRLCGTKA